MFSSPEILRKVTEQELSWLKTPQTFWKRLERALHFHARVRYFETPLANFTRAGVDCLCALRAVSVLLSGHRNANLFALEWLTGPPSFRGTCTENEIAYVDTAPWAPGVLGRLHVHRRADSDRSEWQEIGRLVTEEIDHRMNPKPMKIGAAYDPYEASVLEALPRARRLPETRRDDIKRVEKLIRDIRSIPIDKLEDHRKRVKDELEKVFKPLVYRRSVRKRGKRA